MAATWRGAEPPPAPPVTALGWVRVVRRGLLLGLVIYGGLAVLLLLRLVERPLFGLKRPLTPFITQAVCRGALFTLGIRCTRQGRSMRARGALVCNHVSWLDIFVLNAAQPVFFVSKSEVAGWPAIGWLARVTGTVFINRSGSDAGKQKVLFEARLRANHRLLFFPEGTSTDGQRVLPFKSTLFAAFYSHGLEEILHVQPLTLRYHAPEGQDPRFYAWWGDMGFAGHLIAVLAAPRQGQVDLVLHEPVQVAELAGRKALAAHCERAVRKGLVNGQAERPTFEVASRCR